MNHVALSVLEKLQSATDNISRIIEVAGACQAVVAACQEASACLEGTCPAAFADSLEVELHTAQEE